MTKLIVMLSILPICLNNYGQDNNSDIFSNNKMFDEYIYINTHYPFIDLINNVEGTTIYKYETDSILKINLLKIKQSSGSSTLDMEGKRLLYNIPRHDGKYPTEEISINFKLTDNKIYRQGEVLECPPEFPGGEAAILKNIYQNFKMPAEASEMSIQGKIICGFVIEKDGSIGIIDIIRPLERSFDAEAMRVIKQLPKWDTGKINGKPVRVYYIIPINISLR